MKQLRLAPSRCSPILRVRIGADQGLAPPAGFGTTMDTVRAKRIASELRGRFVGGWKVGDYAGNGASAVVLAAERAGRHAALKLIDPEMIERFGIEQQLARVQRECELVGHTEPHLVQIFDGGYCEQTSYLYIAMEYFGLPQLTKMISSFPRDRIGAIIQQLAGAAKFLETRGIAHRDIKPDNIVITPDCQNATLLDLGVILPITSAEGNDAGTGEAFLGTTRYSPPEYVMREEVNSELGWRSVTFYQLGAVLHDMIMRDRLFGNVEAPPARLIDVVRHSRPVVDAEEVSPHLLALARNCLQKDWRLRLDLVRWEHFSEVPAPTQAAEVKDRILRRIALGAAVTEAGLVSGPTPGPPPRRLLRTCRGPDRERSSRDLSSVRHLPTA